MDWTSYMIIYGPYMIIYGPYMFQGSGFAAPPPWVGFRFPQESLGFLRKLRVFGGSPAQWPLVTLMDASDLWLEGASSRLAPNTIHGTIARGNMQQNHCKIQ